MNKKNGLKLAIAGVCTLVFVTGCSSKSTDNGNSHTDIRIEDITEETENVNQSVSCLLYTSDAADD